MLKRRSCTIFIFNHLLNIDLEYCLAKQKTAPSNIKVTLDLSDLIIRVYSLTNFGDG